MKKLRPVFAQAAIGEIGAPVPVDENDPCAELNTGINILLEAVRRRLVDLSTVNKGLQVEIAARVGAEQALRREQDELEGRVKVRTAALLKAATQLASEVVSHQHTEADLRDSETRYRLLAEKIPDAIARFDPALRCLYANPAAERLFDRTGEALLGRAPADWDLPAGLASVWERHLQRVLQTGKPAMMEFERMTSLGRRYFQSHLVPETGADRRVERVLTVTRDITEITRAAEALRQSEERFRLLVDGVKDYAIFMMDPEGTVVSWNEGAARIKGFAAADVLGRHYSCFFSAEDAARGQPAQELGQARAAGQYHGEGWRVRKDGTRFWADVLITAVHDRHGRLKGFSKLTRDITDARRADHMLKAFAAELERSNRELQDFAFAASHDLQEPLRKIQAFGDRLRAVCAAVLPPQGVDYLQRMENAARRMQQLIDNLLAYSRVTTKAKPFAPVSLGPIAKEVLSDLEVAIDRSGAAVTVEALPDLEADPMQMRQLLQNLLSNALKFRAADRPPRVRVFGGAVAAAGRAPEIELCVEDNGIGIDGKYHGLVFELFQRLHDRGLYEGTGMGLAICRKIVQRHGGRISIDSRVGEGTTFRVRLPAAHSQGGDEWTSASTSHRSY